MYLHSIVVYDMYRPIKSLYRYVHICICARIYIYTVVCYHSYTHIFKVGIYIYRVQQHRKARDRDEAGLLAARKDASASGDGCLGLLI